MRQELAYRLTVSTLAPVRGQNRVRDQSSPSGPATGTQAVDLVDAALRCVARAGVAATSLDDVGREAGCSRATVYRYFPGGKDALLGAVVEVEVARFFESLDARLTSASDLEEVLVQAVLGAGTALSSHPALLYLLLNEPEVLLPLVSFAELDVVFSAASEFAVPRLARFMPEQAARRTGEWVARVVLSYLSCPSADVDLTDESSVRRLVSTFVLPAVRAVADPQKEGTQWPAPRR